MRRENRLAPRYLKCSPFPLYDVTSARNSLCKLCFSIPPVRDNDISIAFTSTSVREPRTGFIQVCKFMNVKLPSIPPIMIRLFMAAKVVIWLGTLEKGFFKGFPRMVLAV